MRTARDPDFGCGSRNNTEVGTVSSSSSAVSPDTIPAYSAPKPDSND